MRAHTHTQCRVSGRRTNDRWYVRRVLPRVTNAIFVHEIYFTVVSLFALSSFADEWCGGGEWYLYRCVCSTRRTRIDDDALRAHALETRRPYRPSPSGRRGNECSWWRGVTKRTARARGVCGLASVACARQRRTTAAAVFFCRNDCGGGGQDDEKPKYVCVARARARRRRYCGAGTVRACVRAQQRRRRSVPFVYRQMTVNHGRGGKGVYHVTIEPRAAPPRRTGGLCCWWCRRLRCPVGGDGVAVVERSDVNTVGDGVFYSFFVALRLQTALCFGFSLRIARTVCFLSKWPTRSVYL